MLSLPVVGSCFIKLHIKYSAFFVPVGAQDLTLTSERPVTVV